MREIAARKSQGALVAADNWSRSSNQSHFVFVEVKTVEAVAAPVMTVVKNEIEEPPQLTLNEKIQRLEDLTMLIDRWRTLNESRRKLQTFHIGADSMSSTILLKESAGNEFKTSNLRVCF